MSFIILFTFFILVISLILQLYSVGRNINSVLAVGFLFVFSGLITTSADYWAYEYFHTTGEGYMEPMFGIISSFFDKQNFAGLFKFYILSYSILLVWLIKIFYKNPLIIVIIYLPIVYLFYTAQIRFFMGYYSAVLALYFFLQKKKYLIALILFVFAILNHSSIYLMLLFIPFWKINITLLPRYTIYLALGILFVFLLSFFVFSINLGEESRISAYTEDKGLSSIIGGLYFFIPYFLLFLFVYKLVQKRIKENPQYLMLGKLKILYYLAFFPFIFLLVSFFVQIIGHRLIVPASVFVIVLFFKIKPTYREKIFFSFVLLLFYSYIFILPQILFENTTIPVIIETFNSNEFLQKYFF